LAKVSAKSLPGREEWPGTHWSHTETPEREREWREDQSEWRRSGTGTEGRADREDKQERESEQRRKEEKEHEEECATAQESALSSATSSLKALEEWSPARKMREVEEEQDEQRRRTPAPPGPWGTRTEPSVQMARSTGGSEERKREESWKRANGGSVRRQEKSPRERDRVKVGASAGGKGRVGWKGSRGEVGGGRSG
jgi:hypothetical protein